MNDNFDLHKYLKENKVFENANPFTSEDESPKETKTDLKSKIREMVLAELSEEDIDEAKKDKEKEEEVEDIETTDMGEFTDDETPADPEEPSQDLEGDEKAIMDNLEQALEFAKTKGDEKLIDQIGNTITFFTRQYIVK
jgi:hypothetical protein